MRLLLHFFKKISCHSSLDILFLVANIWMMSNVGQLQAQNSQEMSMSTTLPNKNPLSYVGVRAKNPPDLIRETRAPLASEISGPNGPFAIGTIWVNTNTGVMYGLGAVSGGTATWTVLGAGTTDLETLTGDTGGPISPSGGNINILGGDGLTVAGAGSTLTISRDAQGG